MKGRLGSNEHREKYRCDAVLMDAPANPVGSSEDRLLLQSEGKRTRSLYFMTSSHSEPFTLGRGHDFGWGGSLQLMQFPKWADSWNHFLGALSAGGIINPLCLKWIDLVSFWEAGLKNNGWVKHCVVRSREEESPRRNLKLRWLL